MATRVTRASTLGLTWLNFSPACLVHPQDDRD